MVYTHIPFALYGVATKLVAPCLAFCESTYHGLLGRLSWKSCAELLSQRLCLKSELESASSSPVALWFHGASLGETRTALALCAAILRNLHSKDDALLSYDTDLSLNSFLFTSANVAAQEPLLKSLDLLYTTSVGSSADFQARLVPYDFPSCVKRFLFRFLPRNAIFVESELWPNLLLESKNRGVKLFLLDGRLSPTSKRRWTSTKAGRSILKQMLTSFDFIGARNEEEASFFKQFGCANVKNIPPLKILLPLGPERVDCIGSLSKFGSSWMGISTHEPEEISLLKVHKRLCTTWKRVERKPLLILAPRHILRTRKIVHTAQSFGFKSSEIALFSQHSYSDNISLLIVDSYGVLSSFFRMCKIVFVGNSLFSPGGGHNIAEPLHYKCVVLHGANVTNFVDTWHYLNSLNSSSPVTCTIQNEDQLFDRVKYFLLNPEKARDWGELGHKLVKKAERLVVSSLLQELVFRPSGRKSD